jgi:hypothetical protein
MLFALWLIWVSNETSGAAQVGAFNSLEACRTAATNAVHIGPADNVPKYSFLCVQTRSGAAAERKG